ncbi:ABC transporter permease [Rhodococcoides yunnanense]|uniref:ABC transporter permease n=1 Tax=Rhodococcoides yunnanense TaxID=278209 RepID=UPI001C3FCADF|nr:ABC transporter permease [Rhodococcus yunnanensis]
MTTSDLSDSSRPDTPRKGKVTIVVFVAGFALLVLVLLFPAVFATESPTATDAQNSYAAPGWGHVLGTDQLGRDVYSRIIYGAQVSVMIGLVAASIALVIGSVVGLLSALGGRFVDSTFMRAVDIWMAFPEVLLALMIIALVGPGSANIAAAVGFAAAPYYARLIRSQALAVRHSEYVEAAKIIGVHPVVYGVRHVLPNIAGPVVVLASLGTGTAVAAAAGLSLLGLGPPPPSAEWGAMIAAGQPYLSTAWWIATFPGVALVAVVVIFTVAGRKLTKGRR